MNIQTRINRKIRRILFSHIGERMIKHQGMQKLIGVHRNEENIVDRIGDLEIEYDPTSDIGEALLLNGFFEAGDIDFISSEIAKMANPVVFDIGANIGLHSIHWAKVRPNLKIYAFEPSPDTGAILQKNVTRNALSDRISLISSAVADHVGTATFFNSVDNAFSSLRDTGRKQVANTLTVPVTTIDEFVSSHSIDKISLIKVDVEGYEKEVILGAINTLQTLRPNVFIEIQPLNNPETSAAEIIGLIKPLGYNPFILVDGTLVSPEDSKPDHDNYYFVATID